MKETFVARSTKRHPAFESNVSAFGNHMPSGLHDEMNSWNVLTCRKDKQVYDDTAVGGREADNTPGQCAEWTGNVTVVPNGTWYATAKKKGRPLLNPQWKNKNTDPVTLRLMTALILARFQFQFLLLPLSLLV